MAERIPATQELGQVLRDYLAVADRLQATHEALEQEIQRLRRELRHKDRELEQRRRLAALGEVAAGVAHEVRNPLAAIQLYSGLLRHQCAADHPALALLDKIETGIGAIEAVVRSSLALAPGRACRVEARPIAPILERAAIVSAEAFARRGVALHTHLDDETVRVPCDEDALQRALVNVLNNAADASPPGTAVDMTLRRGERSTVRVIVRDRGPGLSPDALERIFNPFFTTKEGGTGLGLAIAHRLIEAHDGRMTARNAPDGGAVFTIVLPRAAERAATHDDRPPDDGLLRTA